MAEYSLKFVRSPNYCYSETVSKVRACASMDAASAFKEMGNWSRKIDSDYRKRHGRPGRP